MYRRVDGLIIMAPDQGGFDASHRVLRSMPVVYVNSPFESSLSDSIGFNNFEGFYNITSHLVNMGHRRIAMITGPATAIDAQERLRGYRQALRDGGIELEPSLEVVGNFTRQSGYQAVSTILGSRKRPTAIAAANDLSAMGAISALHEAGVRIPDQMAITGFDDDPSARYSTPPLSTVRVRPREMGRLAIQYLVGRIRKVADAEGRKIELPFEIVLRASSLGSRREGASRTS
jgi:LacI family transcriptional regulator